MKVKKLNYKPLKSKAYTLRTDLEKARASALASLCMREHSIKEITDKLTRKDYQKDSIEVIIQECLKDNYLNDQRFAEIYWRSRARKGFGPNKITMELKQKGIASELIQSTSIQQELNFDEIIKIVYKKKFRGRKIHDFKDMSKRQNYLYQRGFGVDLIKMIIKY